MTRDTKNILAFGLVLWLAAGLVVFVAINFGGNAEPYDGYIAAGDNAYEIRAPLKMPFSRTVGLESG